MPMRCISAVTGRRPTPPPSPPRLLPPTAAPQAFAPELIAHHPCAHERVLQVELVQPPHQPQVALADRARQVVHRAAADTEQLGLARDAQVMGTVDHRFALSNPALVSARSKKS